MMEAPRHARPPRLTLLIGHLLRWILILLLIYGILTVVFGPRFWSLEAVVNRHLMEVEMPPADVVSQMSWGHKQYSLLLEDKQNKLYHQMLVSHKLGFIWATGSGSAGTLLDEGIRGSYSGGMSTIGSKQISLVSGQIHDSRVTEIRVVQPDGTEFPAYFTGTLYHAVYRIPPDSKSSSSYPADIVRAYDAAGTVLFELSWERSEIRQ